MALYLQTGGKPEAETLLRPIKSYSLVTESALDDVTYDDMGSFRKRHLVDKCSPVTESQGHENAENEKVAFSLYFVDLLK